MPSVSTEVRVEPCPQCGSMMANDPRYAVWCDACGWNLVHSNGVSGSGRLERWRSNLAGRWARALAEEVIRRGPHRPRLTLSTSMALAVAVAVFGVTLGTAALGIALIAAGSVIGAILGLFFLLLAWVIRPRFPRLDEPSLGRHDLPRLFALLDRVAAALSAPPVDYVVITGDLNAAYGQYGWRRRRVVFLGLPLFLSLDADERVALIAHEVSHGVNGDASRSFVIHEAVMGLVTASTVFEPDSILPSPDEGLAGYAAVPLRIVQLGFARAILALAFLELILCFRTQQRAEYYADMLTARLAGSVAIRALFARLYAASSVAHMNWGYENDDPVGLSVDMIRTLPGREIERLRRVDSARGEAFGTTHPPTAERERVVASRPTEPGSLRLATDESNAIDRELESFRLPIGRQIVDAYLASIS
jgi:Zn-dependent protease with chaperone function